MDLTRPQGALSGPPDLSSGGHTVGSLKRLRLNQKPQAQWCLEPPRSRASIQRWPPPLQHQHQETRNPQALESPGLWGKALEGRYWVKDWFKQMGCRVMFLAIH